MRRKSDLAGKCVDADLDDLAGLQLALALGQKPGQIGAHDRDRVHITGLTQANRDCARLRGGFRGDSLDYLAAVEDILVAGNRGLVHQYLLRPETDDLLGLVRERHRLAKPRQLQRVDAGARREHDRQRLVCDPDYVDLGLLLGERQRAHLASRAERHILDPVFVAAQFAPEFEVCANLADLGDQLDPAVDEKRNAAHGLIERRRAQQRTQRVEEHQRVAERIAHLLGRSRAALHVVIAAAVDRVPVRHALDREANQLGRNPE